MNKRFISFCGRLRPQLVYLLLACLLVFEIFAIALSGHYISLFKAGPLSAEGIITDVSYAYNRGDSGCYIYMDGDMYRMCRRTYNRRTFGIKLDIPSGELEDALTGCIGEEARIEYVSLAPEGRIVTQLSVGSTYFMDEKAAISDHIGHHQSILIGAIIFLIVTLACFGSVIYGMKAAITSERNEHA